MGSSFVLLSLFSGDLLFRQQPALDESQDLQTQVFLVASTVLCAWDQAQCFGDLQGLQVEEFSEGLCRPARRRGKQLLPPSS